MNWKEVERVAALPAYDCDRTVAAMKQEVQEVQEVQEALDREAH